MLNYIRSELYRIRYSKGYLIFFAVCAILLIGVNLLLSSDNELGASMLMTSRLFGTVGLLTLCISDMVFSNEYKNQTLKNTLAFGISRTQIYFGKFITEVIVSFAAAGVVFGIYLASGYLLLSNSPGMEVHSYNFFVSLAGSVPVWLGFLALGHLCMFLIRGGTAAGFTFAGLILVPNMALTFLGIIEGFGEICGTVSRYLLWNQFSPLMEQWYSVGAAIPPTDLIMPTVIGLAHMAVFLLIGLMLFKKKEV